MAVVAARIPAQVEHDPVEGEMAVGVRVPPGKLRLVLGIAQQPSHAQDEHAGDECLLDGGARLLLLSALVAPARSTEEADVLVAQRLPQVELQLGDGGTPGPRVPGQPARPGRQHLGRRLDEPGRDAEVPCAQQPRERLRVADERLGVTGRLGPPRLCLLGEPAQIRALGIEVPVDSRPLAVEVDAQNSSSFRAASTTRSTDGM
jgi:hypothetical protein